MFKNPFSPIFGGKPEVFFGRKEILERFEMAMEDHGSDDRALFFTGMRGCGKTALLEQLSIKARTKKRKVVDLGPEDTIKQLIAELSDFSIKTDVVNSQANLTIPGIVGGASAKSISKTKQIGREHLTSLLLDSCKREKNGILVTIDEAQKVPIEDMSSLCNAFQMASRKGYDIMLAVAGLPYSYETITKHEGCTYLRRASHDTIGLFTWGEAEGALWNAFASIKGLSVSQNIIDTMNQSCYGHPYLMQLMGYYLISHVNETKPGGKYTVSSEDVDVAVHNALSAYERRALKPLVDEISWSEKKFLMAMSDSLDEATRRAPTGDIAKRFGSSQSGISRVRAALINNGIIASPQRGFVIFCVPYLADYIHKDADVDTAVRIAQERRV